MQRPSKEAVHRRRWRQVGAAAEVTRDEAQTEADNARAEVARDKASQAAADTKAAAAAMMVAARADVEKEVAERTAAAMDAAVLQAMANVSRLSAKLNAISESTMCYMCLSEPKAHLLLPCGHKCACEDCVTLLNVPGATCPLCRADVTSSMRVYE